MINSRRLENVQLQIFKVMKTMFKTRFSHYILSNIILSILWRCHLGILYLSTYNTTIKGAMNQIYFKQHFPIIVRSFDQKIKV